MSKNMKVLVGLSTGEYIRRAEFLPHFLFMDKPNGTIMATVHGQSPAESRNLIAQQAIDNKCTHVLFVDDDIILQKDTLVKLMRHNKDVVTALYLLRSFPHYPALFDEAFESGANKFTFLDSQSGLIKSSNCGLGCVLISTDVFKKMEEPWVRLGEIKKDGWCDDVGFFNRCREAGFEIWCDLDAAVGHMTGLTLWPEKHEGKWMTNYRHQNGNVLIPQNIPTLTELEEAKGKEIQVSV